MRLVGVLLSPYVRRVAVSLNILELTFDFEEVFVFGRPDIVRRYNPLARIPALVLDDGTSLVDSWAILDEIDQRVDAGRRLIPTASPLRREVLRTTAIAIGAAEKAQWAFYEDRVRPPQKVHTPWIDHNDKQVLGGFEHLNSALAKVDGGMWIARTSDISQADVTTAVAFTFANLARPDLNLRGRFPQLSRFTDRCESLPAFVEAPLPSAAKLNDWLSQPFVR